MEGSGTNDLNACCNVSEHYLGRSPSRFGSGISISLGFYLLVDDVFLRVRETGYRVERVYRLCHGVVSIAPEDMHGAVCGSDTHILAQRVARPNDAIVIG